MRLVILGGSTPFCVPLIEEVTRLPNPGELVLHGRDAIALDAVAGWARRRLNDLGWSVRAERDLAAALDGASVIVHQIRYGGLAGRSADEQLASALGVPADETLGPAALSAALRAVPGVRGVAAEIQRSCPGALVLNLTNPLSVTTAVFAELGVAVWGLCELPLVTVGQVATALGFDLAEVSWAYTGLNHRGFLHHVRHGNIDLLDQLAPVLADRTRLGVTGAEVTGLRAVPLKYFGLLSGWTTHGAGRAARIANVRAAASRELLDHPGMTPPSLAGRPTPWYAHSVGPVLAAIAGAGPTATVINLPDSDGLVRERCAVVHDRSIRVLPAPTPPRPVRLWLDRFEDHERAVMAAVADPTRAALQTACALDPLLPVNQVEAAARTLEG